MAHPQQQEFVRRVVELLHPEGPLMEIGSVDVNGSVRGLFSAEPYVGIDLAPGRGVDVVASGHDFGRTGAFGTVVSVECLEHDPGWAETLTNVVRTLRPGGTLIVTCASTGRPEHGTSRSRPDSSPGTTAMGLDHYRNLTADDVIGVLGNDMRVDIVTTCWATFDLYLVARRLPAPPLQDAPRVALARLHRAYRVDGLRPSRLSDRALLAIWRADQMDQVPLWAGLLAHPRRALSLVASYLRKRWR